MIYVIQTWMTRIIQTCMTKIGWLKLDDNSHHPKVDDWNHPKLDDYCLFLFYIKTNELKSYKIGWLLHTMKKSTKYGWLRSSILGTRPYLYVYTHHSYIEHINIRESTDSLILKRHCTTCCIILFPDELTSWDDIYQYWLHQYSS